MRNYKLMDLFLEFLVEVLEFMQRCKTLNIDYHIILSFPYNVYELFQSLIFFFRLVPNNNPVYERMIFEDILVPVFQ